MTSVLDPPTAGNGTAAPLPILITRIEICETMLSPFASRENAHWMVSRLRELGWPAKYSAHRATWQFRSFGEAARFKDDFERILASACPPYVWPVYCPDEQGFMGPDWAVTVAAVDFDIVQSEPVGGVW